MPVANAQEHSAIVSYASYGAISLAGIFGLQRSFSEGTEQFQPCEEDCSCITRPKENRGTSHLTAIGEDREDGRTYTYRKVSDNILETLAAVILTNREST
jgi:hypothetical protein